ncbi:MAG: hypothetical protein JNN28_21500 [Saprospiraceae bacterium]|nr:hypothetical protein [Saprospiraceae bacterium]
MNLIGLFTFFLVSVSLVSTSCDSLYENKNSKQPSWSEQKQTGSWKSTDTLYDHSTNLIPHSSFFEYTFDFHEYKVDPAWDPKNYSTIRFRFEPKIGNLKVFIKNRLFKVYRNIKIFQDEEKESGENTGPLNNIFTMRVYSDDAKILQIQFTKNKQNQLTPLMPYKFYPDGKNLKYSDSGPAIINRPK